MAVIQISKIQVRRGLQENLPQLGSGELGWSIDERRLWIGNGTLAEGAPELGNTEIVTVNSDISAALTYYFRGDESGYESQTGPTPAEDVMRTIQNKLDETVSFRDFITPADAASNDYTTALRRAISEIWPTSYYGTPGVNRRLHIPAGIYPVSDTIDIPPYTSIYGDNVEGTIIRQNDNFPLFEMDSGAASNPQNITIADLTLETTKGYDIVLADSTSNLLFDRVKFKGNVTIPLANTINASAVLLSESIAETKNVIFNECQFTKITYGITASGNVSGVVVNNSNFDTLYQGVVSSADAGSPQGIKILTTVFDNIAKQAITSSNDSAITSAFNHYKTVGTGNATVLSSETANTAVLTWATANNYSIGDLFNRSNVVIKPLIEITGVTAPTKVNITTSGSLQETPGFTETLTNNTTANTALTLVSSTVSAIIDYSVVRGTAKRIGSIKITHFNGSVVYEDDYSEIGTPGVTLAFVGDSSANSAVLGYTTTNTGTNATIKYNIRSFV